MLWLKSFHLIGIVCWFAGLFYLPRLFVYHAQCDDEPGNQRFKIMERKLYRGITTPSMIITIVFGLSLLSGNPDYYATAGWLHAKLALVLLLVIYHLACGRFVKQFARDQNRKTHVFYRWFNELPVFALVGCIILATVRPF